MRCWCVAGIGKSTLLNLIAGVLEPTKGQISRNPKVPLSCVCLLRQCRDTPPAVHSIVVIVCKGA